jgi:sortase A
MKSNDKKNSLILLIITPFIIFLICVGIILIASIKPYNKVSVYLNLAFMDNLKSVPDGGLNGLVIRENDIETDYSGETSENGETVMPQYGEMFAILRCDKLDTSVPVYWGSGSELLERGACQATYSKLPGGEGNTVISAHEDTFFSGLSDLQEGDVVTINTNYGEFTYTVTELISFKKTEKKYVNPSDDVKLTLYTCKKDILGSSDERIGVICELTDKKFYVSSEEDSGN